MGASTPAVLSLGELLIDFVPEERGVTLAEARSFVKAPGGAPANVAVGVARLGIASGFIGKVGDDPFGHHLADVLASEGVDIHQLRFDDGARTALAFVSLTREGERDFMFYRHPSADMRHRPDEVDADAIRAARVLHVGSISLISEPAASATRFAVRVAREAGVTVSYDPNLRLPLWPSAEAAADGIRSLLPHADLVKVSDDELVFLTGGDDLAHARSLWRDDWTLLLVTRGAQGVDYLLPDAEGRVAGFAVDTRDTTGAGDAFTAAVLTAVVRDTAVLRDRERLEQALLRANAFAALTTTRPGAIPAMPTPEELEAFLASHGAA
jgi:fructokinase